MAHNGGGHQAAGRNTRGRKQKAGNKMGGGSLNFQIKGGGNQLGGGVINVGNFAGSKKPKGMDSKPIPKNEQ